jgi:hypothetical protein
MRLWNTLQTSYRDKLAGRRSTGHKNARRAERPRTRPEVEALDQRLLPSSVPNLGGLTMGFLHPWSGTNDLTIQSVQDQGGGKGTFAGTYLDNVNSNEIVWTTVSGTITLKGMTNAFGGSWYDFGVSFSGTSTRSFFGSGGWYIDFDKASGSGDFLTPTVSGNAGAYGYYYGAIPWYYSGQESDGLARDYLIPNWGWYIWTESGPVTDNNLLFTYP